MTCIAALVVKHANKVYMAADSQATHNGCVLVHGLPKIVERDGFLFASDGSLWLGDACRYLDLPVWTDGVPLAQWCAIHFGPWLRACANQGNHWVDRSGGKEWNGQTFVARGGELCLVDAGGGVIVPAGSWWAIGSGGAEARGAMSALEDAPDCYAPLDGNLSPRDILSMAVGAAILLDDGCCGPVQYAETP